MDENDGLRLTALLMAAILVVPAGLRAAKGRIPLYVAVWSAVFAALVWGYDFFSR